MNKIQMFRHHLKVCAIFGLSLVCFRSNPMQVNPASLPIKAAPPTTPTAAPVAITPPATPSSGDGNVEPGICALKDNIITVTNDGKHIGMVEVATLPGMTSEKTVLLLNTTKEKPNNINEGQMHMGYGSHNRQKILFRGAGKVKCYTCRSMANDPNDRPMCADPLDVNNCLKCSQQPTDCSKSLSIARCHAQGDPWAGQAKYEQEEGRLKSPKDNLAIRLGLIKELPKGTSAK